MCLFYISTPIYDWFFITMPIVIRNVICVNCFAFVHVCFSCLPNLKDWTSDNLFYFLILLYYCISFLLDLKCITLSKPNSLLNLRCNKSNSDSYSNNPLNFLFIGLPFLDNFILYCHGRLSRLYVKHTHKTVFVCVWVRLECSCASVRVQAWVNET